MHFKPLNEEKVYFENLDGLRFLCFLSVFFFHSFHSDFVYIKQEWLYKFVKYNLFGNGNLGVNVFFVLSGFLITYLLLIEKSKRGNIDFLKFYIRRALRIWPLFYFCVFFGFVVFPQLKLLFGQQPNETAEIIYYLTFTNNFNFINNGLPDASVLGVLWSIAVEEQFYLIWPIFIAIIPNRKLWVVFACIILITLIFRTFYNNPVMLEHHTLSCIGDMTMGALAAWLMQFEELKRWVTDLNKKYIFLIYAIFVVVFFFRSEILFENEWLIVIERLLIATVISLIILEQCFSKNSFYKFSNFKRISKLGLITYGLYCLHFIGILVVTNLTKKLEFNTELWQVLLIDSSLSLLLTIIIAKFSFRYFESPFLKLKNKYARI